MAGWEREFWDENVSVESERCGHIGGAGGSGEPFARGESAGGRVVRGLGISRRAFLAGAGTVLASLTLPLVSGPAAAYAEGEGGAADAAGAASERIVIVHTNDVHCSLKNAKTNLGYAALMDYVNSQRKTYGAGLVSLVDAGDNVQGDFEGSFTKGEAPARVIGACKYDLLTLGNHEFDYGMEQLFKLRQTEGNLPIVCCNFVDKNGGRVYDAYRVLEYKTGSRTVRVAYVGATTPSTLTTSTPASFKDDSGNYIYGFCGDASGQALYNAIQAAVDEARSVGHADYVVLVAHLGQEGSVERWKSDTVVANTTGIDAVIDGHSHEMYVQTKPNKNGQGVVIVQTGTKFQSFGRIEIDPAAGTATAQLSATGVAAELIEQWDGEDAETAALVNTLESELEAKKNAQVCTSEVFLRAYEDDGSWAVRRRETNLADLVADAYLYHAANYGEIYDIAVVNAGGVRANVNKGTVTYGNVVSVAPYMNQLCGLAVSGQHVLDMLEIGVAGLPEAQGGFLQVSEGASYTVRLDIPTPVAFNEDGSAVAKIEGERRVKNAKIDGKEIDPAATYKVLASNYILLNGGNKMPIPVNADDAEYLDVDTDAIIDYLQVNLKGVIGQAYANEDGQGRIKLLDHDDGSDDGSGGSDGSDKSEGADKGDGSGGSGDSDKGDDTPAGDGGAGNGGSDGEGGASSGSSATGAGSKGGTASASSSKRSGASLPQTGDAAGAVATAAALAGAASVLAGAGLSES